jgi:MraZ protein
MDNTIEIWAKEMADKPFMEPEEFEKGLEEIMGTTQE